MKRLIVLFFLRMKWYVILLALLAPLRALAVQCGVPISDLDTDAWVEAGGDFDGNAFNDFDEDTACDSSDDGLTTFWLKTSPEVADELDFNLTSFTDPADNTNHTLRWTARKNSSGGKTVDCTIELEQGGTLIHADCADTESDLSGVFTDFTFNLPTACTSQITDYGDLDCSFYCDESGGGTVRHAYLTSCSLEVPDVSAGIPAAIINNPIVF